MLSVFDPKVTREQMYLDLGKEKMDKMQIEDDPYLCCAGAHAPPLTPHATTTPRTRVARSLPPAPAPTHPHHRPHPPTPPPTTTRRARHRGHDRVGRLQEARPPEDLRRHAEAREPSRGQTFTPAPAPSPHPSRAPNQAFIFDGRDVIDHETARKIGFEVWAVGKSTFNAGANK